MSSREATNSTDVILLRRRTSAGQYSVERVVDDIAGAHPPDVEVSVVEAPHVSVGVLPRLRNLVFASRLRADVVHVTGDIQYCALAVPSTRSVVTVLDLVSLRRLAGWRRTALELLWYRLPARRAGAIVVISEAVRTELIDLTPLAASKSTVIGCPVSPIFSTDDTGVEQLGAAQILQVGTAPNKNLERVAQAASALGVELRVVGRLSDVQRASLDGLPLEYTDAADLTDDEMVRSYRESSVVVFASTYEGFGLPIIEAQACGIPVVTSNIAPMCDVAGGAAVLVDPYDVASIRRGLEQALDEGRRAELIEAGLANAARSSPERIAAEYAEVYRRVAASRGRRGRRRRS